MNTFETIPTPETPVTKAQVIESYKKFISEGVTNPDHLDLDDAEVQYANNLFYRWIKKGNEKAGDDPIAQHRFNSEINFFYLDAGFTDPVYVADVLEDFAGQDIDAAEEIDPALAEEIKTRVAEYKARLLPEGSE